MNILKVEAVKTPYMVVWIWVPVIMTLMPMMMTAVVNTMTNAVVVVVLDCQAGCVVVNLNVAQMIGLMRICVAPVMLTLPMIVRRIVMATGAVRHRSTVAVVVMVATPL